LSCYGERVGRPVRWSEARDGMRAGALFTAVERVRAPALFMAREVVRAPALRMVPDRHRHAPEPLDATAPKAGVEGLEDHRSHEVELLSPDGC
jgi:hypothetical protein